MPENLKKKKKKEKKKRGKSWIGKEFENQFALAAMY